MTEDFLALSGASVRTQETKLLRRNTKRNLARCFAVAEKVQEDPGNWSLQGVAARAEVGVATAYRYFPSLDELREATIAPPKNSATSTRSARAGALVARFANMHALPLTRGNERAGLPGGSSLERSSLEKLSGPVLPR